jgi:geranylgeranyl pyrophosphate synthase
LSTVTFFTPVLDGLQEVEQLLRHQADDDHPDLRAALDHLLSSGGKRIRPALALLTGQMLGGPHDKLVTLAAAVELLHNATLVHDDLIDGALLRRGMPTLNTRWSPAATVLTGDFMFSHAARLAADTDNLPLIKHFAETLAVIVNGELTQLFSAKGVVSQENYYQRIYAKTASLMEMTTRAAAMVSSVNDSVTEALRRYGYHLGMAFQIVDDILDITGQQDELGKTVGSDLLQGLVTLPALYYIEDHPDQEEVRILVAGESNPRRAQMETLVQSIRSSDAIRRAMDEARGYIDRAIENLAGMPEGNELQALLDLARFIVDRRL